MCIFFSNTQIQRFGINFQIDKVRLGVGIFKTFL
ncbi:hypothetical protein BGP_6578 [Beggiatoa sp. PS]|nr:hypothetical protein BGP_6578 [Beggiatoa sp. PS]